MAKKTDSFSEGIKDITECCICYETFSNPRMLPCIHTFCHNCLEKMSEQFNWRIREKAPCPLCKQEFILPEDGVSGIPKNFFMENLIDMTKKANLSQEEEFCDQCQENDASSLAEVYCIECDEKLCQECAKYHKRQKQLRNHQVVELGTEAMNVGLQKKSATAFCRVHTEKPVEMFCNDCNDAICVVCYAVNHQAHKCSELTNAANIFKEELRSYVTEIDRCLEDSNKQKDALMKISTNFIGDVARVEGEINKTANKLIEFVESSRESLIFKLNSLKLQTLKGNETQKYEMDSYITILETFKTYCLEVVAKASNGDICKQITNLKTRSSELQTLHDSCSKQSLSSPEVVFKKSRFEDNLKEELNCIGTIEDWNSSANNDPIPIIVNQKHLISPFGELRVNLPEIQTEVFHGHIIFAEMAPSSEYQYIGHKNSNTILSIPRNKPRTPDRVQEEFVIEQLEALCDIAPCTISNSLYAVDSGSDSVWKIDLENRQVIRWLKGISDPYTLSVCGDGRVVIPRDGQPAKVEVYAPDATLLEAIQLAVEIRNVFRAFETSTEKLVILNSCIDSSAPLIWQVNREGHVTHTYAPKNEQEITRDFCIIPWSHDGAEIMVLNCVNIEKLFFLDSELAVVGDSDSDIVVTDNDDGD